MKPLGWLQVAFGVFGLLAEVAFAGPQLPPASAILVASFNILAIVAGALLLRRPKVGVPTSLVLWGVQAIQILTPQFAFDFLLGPYICLRSLPNHLTFSFGASFTRAALGSQTFSSMRHEISVNLLALIAIVYLIRRSRDLIWTTTPPVAGGLTSA